MPNRWGLHDLQGNVVEWCQDWYADPYPNGNGSATDPAGAASGTKRVVRGGAYHSHGDSCRSANRFALDPNFRNDTVGFRIVLGAR